MKPWGTVPKRTEYATRVATDTPATPESTVDTSDAVASPVSTHGEACEDGDWANAENHRHWNADYGHWWGHCHAPGEGAH